MRDDDFVDTQLACFNVKRKGHRAFGVKINLVAMIQNVSLCTRRCAGLLGDRLLLPTLPGERVLSAMVELAAFAIKEEKDAVLEYGNEIAKLLAVCLKWAG